MQKIIVKYVVGLSENDAKSNYKIRCHKKSTY